MENDQHRPIRLGHPLVQIERVGSTMDLAQSLAESGAGQGTTVLAAHQTAGRGRHGRMWVAPPGTALLASVVLRPHLRGQRLGIIAVLAGLAVARAIERRGAPSVTLKWPNDVLIEGRKVAGVLTSSRLGTDGQVIHVIVGMGVNLSDHPRDTASHATDLSQYWSRPIAAAALLGDILDELSVIYDRNRERTDQASLADVQRHLAYIGEQVEVVDHGRVIRGVVEEVDPDGALMMSCGEAGIIRVVSGELTRGPRPVPGP